MDEHVRNCDVYHRSHKEATTMLNTHQMDEHLRNCDVYHRSHKEATTMLNTHQMPCIGYVV